MEKPWGPENYIFRLPGWTMRVPGPPFLLYEANSQAPKRHLTLGETRLMGALLFDAVAGHVLSPRGKKLLDYTDAAQKRRRRQWLFWRRGFEVGVGDSVFLIEDNVGRFDIEAFDHSTLGWNNYHDGLVYSI